jgi:hypothetical protein
MGRYFDARKEIPQDWHDELAELNEWLSNNGYTPLEGFTCVKAG